ncbi:MAG TPA: hypothetical protein EYN27_04510 [Rhodospirillales bacterium]|nr:hypothetical protein [Phycisphaerales bacterium]HIO38192.1 hypothetical protein [Rhodospirillales bacterium]
MKDKKNKQCYSTLLGKLNSLDNQIVRVKDQIEELRKLITGSKEETIKEITEEICLETTLLVEPTGDV